MKYLYGYFMSFADNTKTINFNLRDRSYMFEVSKKVDILNELGALGCLLTPMESGCFFIAFPYQDTKDIDRLMSDLTRLELF